MDIKKYKWLYLWIAAAGLIVFGAVMLLAKEFGQKVILYISAVLLIAFTVIRFIPLIKTIKNRWAISINAIEMFVDLICGILIIVFAAKKDSKVDFTKIYPFILGGTLYLRGLVYFLEVSFFKTKPEISKFFIHLALITVASIIMGRYDSFSVEAFRWLFGIAFCLSGAIAIVDGGNNYNEYRKKYVKKNKKIKKSDTIVDKKEDEIPVVDPTISDNKEDNNYIQA